MSDYRYARLTDAALLRELAARLAQSRAQTADVVALIAEVDARRLYVPAGYSSMHSYCVGELHCSDDEAYKRITAARTARRFPVLFKELAEGRLHLTAVCTLAPHLTEENLDELVQAARHRRRTEIEDFLLLRFPPRSAEVPASSSVSQSVLLPELAPERAESGGQLPARVKPFFVSSTQGARDSGFEPVRAGVSEVGVPESGLPESGLPESRLPESGVPESQLAPERVSDEAAPLAPERVEASQVKAAQRAVERLIQLSIRKSTYEKLRYAQALLSHAIPSRDVSQLLDRALNLLIAKVEKRRFGSRRDETARRGGSSPGSDGAAASASARSRGSSSGVSNRAALPRTRYIPTRVRRAVWERDNGKCTFVGPKGNRCSSEQFLEFDHVNPYARGGKPTVEGLRLRCSNHNQFEALRVFGAEFMRRKRRERRARDAQARKEAQRARSGTKTPDPTS